MPGVFVTMRNKLEINTPAEYDSIFNFTHNVRPGEGGGLALVVAKGGI